MIIESENACEEGILVDDALEDVTEQSLISTERGDLVGDLPKLQKSPIVAYDIPLFAHDQNPINRRLLQSAK